MQQSRVVPRAASSISSACLPCQLQLQRTSIPGFRKHVAGTRAWSSSTQSILSAREQRWRCRSNGAITGIPHHSKRFFASVVSDAVLPHFTSTSNAASDVQRIWQIDDSWAAQFSNLGSKEQQQETMQQRVRQHIDTLYPECARAGTIEDLGESQYQLEDGTPSTHTNHNILVLDDDFTGDLHSLVSIVNLPADADVAPGKWIRSRVMEEAKRNIIRLLSDMGKSLNVKHAVCRVFVGGDAVWCRFQPHNTEPTITKLEVEPSAEYKEQHDRISQKLREAQDPSAAGVFRGMQFEKMLQEFYAKYPGCTVWDEGPLQFNVAGEPCAEPTRLIVVRRFEVDPENHFQPAIDVDATVYGVTLNVADPKARRPLRMVQSRDPNRHLGEIVGAVLMVATPLEDGWPKCGDYAESAMMKAAQGAAVELLEMWNRQGKIRRCVMSVWMGNDLARFKCLSENLHAPTVAVQDPKLEPHTIDTVSHGHPSLDPFFVALEELENHKVMSSEIQWQAMQGWTRQQAEENPQYFIGTAPQTAFNMAHGFLKRNYPGCDVCDEGEMVAIMNGEATSINATRLVVAKDPTKTINNVLAVLHLMPLPDPDMTWNQINDANWIGTQQMAIAEYLLKEVLKRWYTEGKLADDCLAMMMMANDTTMYRFVDGERFEDYPEERMKLFKMQ